MARAKRQTAPDAAPSPEKSAADSTGLKQGSETPALSAPTPKKLKRARKRNPEQREMLLPIIGGAKAAETRGNAQRLEAKRDREAQSAAAERVAVVEGTRAAPDLAAFYARPHRYLGPVETLEYLAREWEAYGTIDATNMRHVYWALAAERERASSPSAAPVIPSPAERGRAEPPTWIEPQLSKPVDEAPSGPEWVHELRFDGYRIAARIDHGEVQLLTQSGQDWTDKCPSLVEALEWLPVETAYIDGVLRPGTSEGVNGLKLSPSGPAAPVYHAFDLMELDGAPVHRLLLAERKRRLAAILERPPAGVAFSEHVWNDGAPMLSAARRQGLAGIVSKRSDAAYASGANGLWVESKSSRKLKRGRSHALADFAQRVDDRRQIEAPTLQIVTGAFDGQQPHGAGNQGDGHLHLRQRAERIGGPVNEDRGRAQLRKMRGPDLLGLPRGMQGIGKQQEAVNDVRLFGRQHAGLTSAVGLAAEVNLAVRQRSHLLNRASQTRAIGGGHSRRRRPFRALLTERQIAAQDAQARVAKRASDRDQQGGGAIAARAMRQHETAVRAGGRRVKKASHAFLLERDAIRRCLWHGSTRGCFVFLCA